jgi:hypothetical protein
MYALSVDKSDQVTFVGYAKNSAVAKIAAQLYFNDDNTVTLKVGVPSWLVAAHRAATFSIVLTGTICGL